MGDFVRSSSYKLIGRREMTFSLEDNVGPASYTDPRDMASNVVRLYLVHRKQTGEAINAFLPFRIQRLRCL